MKCISFTVLTLLLPQDNNTSNLLGIRRGSAVQILETREEEKGYGNQLD